MGAEILPKKGEKLLCEGMEITELLRCRGLKPVIAVDKGKISHGQSNENANSG